MKKINMPSYRHRLAAICLSPLSLAISIANGEQVASEEVVSEEVVVIGIRDSLEKSAEIKREANQIMDAITAEDIGKLPDKNIAEAIQRITGVQIGRERAGEGSSFQVRGFSQNRVEIDGRSLLSPDSDSRSNNFNGISSSLFSGVEVIKSPSASDTEGAIGGTVRLVTRKPLDTPNNTVSLGVNLSQDGEWSETDPQFNLFASKQWETDNGATFGALLSVSIEDYHSRTDEWDSNAWGDLTVDQHLAPRNFLDGNGGTAFNPVVHNAENSTSFPLHPGDNTTVWAPFGRGGRYERAYFQREKQGLDFSLQYALDDKMEFYFSGNHNRFDSQNNESKTQVEFASWERNKIAVAYNNSTEDYLQFSNTGVELGTANNDFILAGTAIGRDSLNWWEVPQWLVRMNPAVKDTNENQYSLAFGGQMSWERLDVKFELSSAEAERDYVDMNFNINPLPLRPNGLATNIGSAQIVEFDFGRGRAPISKITMTQDLGNGQPMTFNKADGWAITNVWAQQTDNFTDEQSARFDLSYSLGNSLIHSVKSGVRLAKQNIQRSLRQLRDPYDGLTTINGWYQNNNNNFFQLAIAAGEKDPNIRYAPESVTDRLQSESEALISEMGTISSEHSGNSMWRYPLHFGNLASIDEFTDIAETLLALDDEGRAVSGPALVWDASYLRPYDITEETSAFYLQFDFEKEFGQLNFTGNFGLRYVKTDLNVEYFNLVDNKEQWYDDTDDFDSSASSDLSNDLNLCDVQNYKNNAIAGEAGLLADNTVIGETPLCDQYNAENFRQSSADNSYNNVLPSVNVSMAYNDDHVFRFALGKAMARPDPRNLSPAYNVAANTANIDQGNPELSPFISNYMDLSYEWYFAEGSLFSAAVFYKDVKNFFVKETSEENLGYDRNRDGCYVATIGQFFPRDRDNDGMIAEGEGLDCTTDVSRRDNVFVTRNLNGDSGKIKGFELGIQHSLDKILPSPFDGLGYVLNYTFNDSEQDGGENLLTGEALPMENLSKNSYNAILYYEKSGFGARLAYTYRDDFVTSAVNRGIFVFEDNYDQLDLSLNYQFNDQLSFAATATNLSDSTQYRYFGHPDISQRYREYGRRYSLNINYKL